MTSSGFFVEFEARPGKEAAVAEFLIDAKKLVDAEPGTLAWFSFRHGPRSFGIFDAFGSESDRAAHLNGKVRDAIDARGEELFSQPPTIAPLDILAAKLPSRAALQL